MTAREIIKALESDRSKSAKTATFVLDLAWLRRVKSVDFVPEVIGHALHAIVSTQTTFASISSISTFAALYRLYYYGKETAKDDAQLVELLQFVFQNDKGSSAGDNMLLFAASCEKMFEKKGAALFSTFAKKPDPTTSLQRTYLQSFLAGSEFAVARLENATNAQFCDELLCLFDVLTAFRKARSKDTAVLVDMASLLLVMWHARGRHALVHAALWQTLQCAAMHNDVLLTEDDTLPRKNRWLRVVKTIEDASALVEYDRDRFALLALLLVAVGDDASTCLSFENLSLKHVSDVLNKPVMEAELREPFSRMAHETKAADGEAIYVDAKRSDTLVSRMRLWYAPESAKRKRARKDEEGDEGERPSDDDGEEDDNDEEEGDSFASAPVVRLKSADAQRRFSRLPSQGGAVNAQKASDVLLRASLLVASSRAIAQSFVATTRVPLPHIPQGTLTLCFGPFNDFRQSTALSLFFSLRRAISLPALLPVPEFCRITSLKADVYNRSALDFDVVLDYVFVRVGGNRYTLPLPTGVIREQKKSADENETPKEAKRALEKRKHAEQEEAEGEDTEAGEKEEEKDHQLHDCADWSSKCAPCGVVSVTIDSFHLFDRQSAILYLFTLAWRYITGMRNTNQRNFYRCGSTFVPELTFDHWEFAQFGKVKRMFQRAMSPAQAQEFDGYVQRNRADLLDALRQLRPHLASSEVLALLHRYNSRAASKTVATMLERCDSVIAALQRTVGCEEGFWRSLI